MRSVILALALLTMPCAAAADDWALAIHGGAGVIERTDISAQQDAALRQALRQALDAGAAVLADGGRAVDAVQAVVRMLEASPLFNAGVGAVLTSAGTVEMDAAIMDGATRKAGAVTGVATTDSPIALARTLMDKGPHLFLHGAAADDYARKAGLAQQPNRHFITDRRRKQLQDLLMQGQGAALPAVDRMGTVGAVARDRAGNLAAATSTGGLAGKAPGRIGDTPVIGAGTLADNRGCAVSGTGSGEIFIRARIASAICERVRFADVALAEAAEAAIAELGALGGDGGVIVVGPAGDALFAMNSAGMYRGRASAGGLMEVKVYGDE